MDDNFELEISVKNLVPGMIVSADVRDKKNRLLLKANEKITPVLLRRMQRFKIPSVFIQLTGENSALIARSKNHGAEGDGFRNLDAELSANGRVIKNNSEFNVYNTFFLQIDNLINRGIREIIRPDVDAADAKRIILRTICNKKILNLLMGIRIKDRYLLSHSVEVTLLSVLIALEFKLPEIKIRNLVLAAMLHDIGMTQISDHILFKAGSLTPEEENIVQSHSAKSVMLLESNPKINKEVLEIILQHHERFDGTGYPRGLTEDIINSLARILSACDVYSAISNARSYRGKLSPQEKIEFFFGSGDSYFSYDIVTTLLNKICIYHRGQWVRLNNGKVGMISAVDDKFPTRPKIRLVYDEYGELIPGKKELLLEERENATVFIEQIL